MRRRIFWISLGLALAATLAAANVATHLLRDSLAARQALIVAQDHETRRAAAEITAVLTDLEQAAAELSRQVAASSGSEPELLAAMTRLLDHHGDAVAVAVAFAPFSFDGVARLAAPMAWRTPEGVRSGRLDATLDYTVPTAVWYATAMARGRSWTLGRGDELGGERVVDFALRVRLNPSGNQIAGGQMPADQIAGGQIAVVRLSYPLKSVAAVVALLQLGHHGYGFLLANDGELIVSPEGRASQSDDREAGSSQALGLVGKALENDGVLSFVSMLTGHKSRLYVTPVVAAEWTLATVYSWRDLELDQSARHHAYLHLSVLLLAAFAAVAVSHLSAGHPWSERRMIKRAWGWALFMAAAFALFTTLIWALVMNMPAISTASGATVTQRSALGSFEREAIRQALIERQKLPLFVPIGIFVQSVEFVSANNVRVTGYMWQRLAPGLAVTPGIILPEAEDSEIEEIYRQNGDDGLVIGWRFRATLRQAFHYNRFPLDFEAVWVRFWPQDFDRNVILVPDFDAYATTIPSAFAGLERSLFVSGWSPVSTFFEYREQAYATGFGFAAPANSARPELYYNIEIKRNFLDPLVSNITPVILVLLLIFAMQMTVTREAAQKDLLGFNAATIITTCAALFFAVLISHIEARGVLSAKRIFYGEYFYLISYAVILFVCINAILFTYDTPVKAIQYRDNLLPKLLYWPVVMGSIYGVTLAVFY